MKTLDHPKAVASEFSEVICIPVDVIEISEVEHKVTHMDPSSLLQSNPFPVHEELSRKAGRCLLVYVCDEM